MERAGNLLDAFLKLHNISGGEDYIAFFKSWHNIVGTDIAAHTRVTDIQNGALKVEVDHPGWMQKLQMKKEQVLRKVATQYPQLEVRTLHVRLVSDFSSSSSASRASNSSNRSKSSSTSQQEDSSQAPGESSSEDTSESRPDPEASKNAVQALNRIEDDTLKNTLSRLYEDLTDGTERSRDDPDNENSGNAAD